MKFLAFLLLGALYGVDLNIVAPYLPENPIVVEAGAHNGSDTVHISRFWPLGQIYAFEPSPDVFPRLKENAQGRSNIQVWQLALGDHVGSADFYLSGPPDAQSSLLPPSTTSWPAEWNYIQFERKIQVPITTLDEWAKENQITHVDFLWLDMQGGEYPMLKASPEILKTVKVIQSEVAKIPYYEGIILYDEFKKWMEGQGFFLLLFEDCGAFGDAVFIRY